MVLFEVLVILESQEAYLGDSALLLQDLLCLTVLVNY